MYAISKRHHARRKHLYEMYSKIRLGHDHSQVIPGLPVCSISVADPVHFFISGSGSADPVFKIRIRIRNPGNPKKTGSYLDMFLMFGKINNFVWHFNTKSKHIMIKDKKLF